MKWKCRACVQLGFAIFCVLILLLTLAQARDLAAASVPVSADTAMLTSSSATVRVHGQIRDTGGNPRQGYVIVSTYLGPDLAQGLTATDGSYQFDVPAQDNYVISVQPIHRVQIGSIEVPTGFLDTWRRVNRGTATDLTVDVIVQPGGTLFLDSYDSQGNRMYRDDFPDAEAFAVYSLGTMPVHKSLQLQNHQRPVSWGWETVTGTLRNPGVILLPSEVTDTFTIWGLWRVPEAGTIMLEMDNGGLGFGVAAGQVITVNLPYEFARTELRKAQQNYVQKTASGYVFSPTISLWLTQAQATVNTAQRQLESGDRQGAAMTAYQALSTTIRAKEEIAMAVARQDIERYRRLPVTITVVGPDLQPISNVQVAYHQINHDFLLSGNWGGDAAFVGDTPSTRQIVGNYNVYVGIAKEIGFEYLNYPPIPVWGLVQREWPSTPFRFDDDVIVRRLADDELRATATAIGIASGDYPRYVESLSYNDIKIAAVNYVTTTVSHYAGKIQWWNLIHETNLANDLNFTPDQMLDFTKAVLTAGKSADTQAVIAVYLTSPGLEMGYMSEPPGHEAPINFIPTYDYLRQMLDYGIRPDAVGVQFYYGGRYPAIDLGTASDLLDVFGRDFDVPIYIEELEYPTHEEYPGLVNMSSKWGWHQGHTDQAQADWAVALYTLAFSKRHVRGANWSLAFDLPADLVEDGRQGDGYLRRDALTLRPMAYALSDLFRSWTITGTAQTDITGRLHFNGFAGEYLITMTGSNGAVRQEKIHVREGQANTFFINFDQNQSLTDNRQSADATLDKVRYAFAWASALGKTSGLAEASTFYAQAQTSYSTGQYWNAMQLGQQALDAIAFHIDGESDDWAGVRPLYSQSNQQGQANGSQLRRFWGTMDSSALYLLFDFSTSTPRRDILFELDTGADGVLDYHIHTVPMGSGTILVRQGDTVLQRIPTIDVIYSKTVEIRIPLVDLGNPTRVEVVQYREDQGGGNFSTPIPSLGVVAPPFRLHLPMILKGR